ncbi:MAG: putative signal transduction protein containing Nacht domain [Pedosphaera sp.]|nr:putative signal transduction protein containing Nacht domain [Pedosphaera sp.]
MSFFHDPIIWNRSRIALALLLLAVIVGFMWLALRPSEPDPVYKGKRLRDWLSYYDTPALDLDTMADLIRTSTNDSERFPASNEAVRHIGTNAIPMLLHRLRAKNSPLTLLSFMLARKQHVFKVKFTSAENLRLEGAYGFEALGARGRDPVPELIRMYETKRFSDFKDDVAEALGGIGPAAEKAVPALVRSLGDTNSGSWSTAVFALGRIHSHPEIAVPALVKCLSAPYPNSRQIAAQAIATFGPDAKPAIPDLLKLLSDSDANVRDSAKDAIKKIDP